MKTGNVFLVIIAAFGAFTLWLYQRDLLASLPQPQFGLSAEQTPLAPQHHRHIEHVILRSDTLGDIGLAISLPDPLPKEKLPILIVLGGLGTGENNIRYVTNAGNNAIIGYDWPMPVRFYSGIGFLTQMPDLYSRLMTIPAQVVSALDWIATQPWADTQRISLLGFSLGALGAPVIQDMAAHDGKSIGWTILAYGGAPFGEMFAANPHIKPVWMRMVLGPLIDVLLRPLEPAQHLPHLSSHFLVLEGRDDSLIPETARDRLREEVPEPKTVIVFEGNHMGVGPDKMALLQKIIDASKKWLVENGAVNPS